MKRCTVVPTPDVPLCQLLPKTICNNFVEGCSKITFDNIRFGFERYLGEGFWEQKKYLCPACLITISKSLHLSKLKVTTFVKTPNPSSNKNPHQTKIPTHHFPSTTTIIINSYGRYLLILMEDILVLGMLVKNKLWEVRIRIKLITTEKMLNAIIGYIPKH